MTTVETEGHARSAVVASGVRVRGGHTEEMASFGTSGRRHVSAPAAALFAVIVLVVMTVVLPGAVAQEPDELGDVDAGREVFASNCAACHGASAEGRGGTPALIGVDDHYTVEEVETIIREGRGGMPAFGGRLSDAQIEDVVAYLAVAPDDDDEAASRHGPPMDRWWDDMMWNGAASGLLVVWMVFGLLLTVLLVVGIVWLVRQVSSNGGRPTDHRQPPSTGAGSGTAREELDRRYARGEISREEYLAIRDDLES